MDGTVAASRVRRISVHEKNAIPRANSTGKKPSNLDPFPSPASYPPPAPPGGFPPKCVSPRLPVAHGAASHLTKQTRQTARLSLTISSEEVTTTHTRRVPHTTYTSRRVHFDMDPTNNSTPPSTKNSPGPSTNIDPFNVDELSAQLPAEQQQQVDSRTPTTFETAPYEEEDHVTEQEEDYDYETPTPPEELPDPGPRDEEETLPPNNHPRAPRSQTLMALMLKNRFYQVFGDEWQKEYPKPHLRRALLLEIRSSIARDVEEAVVQGDNTPGARPESEPRCRCYLHRFFGAHAHILFPTCTRRAD